MLYMYLAPMAADGGGSGGGMAGMDSATAAIRYPLLGFVLAVATAGYAVLTADRTTLAVPTAPSPATSAHIPSGSSHCGLLAPRTANCCHIAMSVTMAYLLVVML
jgi:hypothetical protein